MTLLFYGWTSTTHSHAVIIVLSFQPFSYRPPTKLRECNVFNRGCLTVCSQRGGGSHVTITYDGPIAWEPPYPLPPTQPVQSRSLWKAGGWPSTKRPSCLKDVFKGDAFSYSWTDEPFLGTPGINNLINVHTILLYKNSHSWLKIINIAYILQFGALM